MEKNKLNGPRVINKIDNQSFDSDPILSSGMGALDDGSVILYRSKDMVPLCCIGMSTSKGGGG